MSDATPTHARTVPSLTRRDVVRAAALACREDGATLADVNRRLARSGEAPATTAELTECVR